MRTVHMLAVANNKYCYRSSHKRLLCKRPPVRCLSL